MYHYGCVYRFIGLFRYARFKPTGEELIITLGYALFVFALVAPPNVLLSSGLTIEKLFHRLLGCEELFFTAYHLRRTSLLNALFSSIPLGRQFFLFLHRGVVKFCLLFCPHSYRILYYASSVRRSRNWCPKRCWRCWFGPFNCFGCDWLFLHLPWVVCTR